MKPTIHTSPVKVSWNTARAKPISFCKMNCMCPNKVQVQPLGIRANKKPVDFVGGPGIPMIALLNFYRPPPTRLMHGGDGDGDGLKKPLRAYASEPHEDVSIRKAMGRRLSPFRSRRCERLITRYSP